MKTNLKPADELLTVRNKIKDLKKREDEIKAGMVAGDLDLSGDYAIAKLITASSSRFDRKAAEKELGSLDRFVKKTETKKLMVEELDVELVE